MVLLKSAENPSFSFYLVSSLGKSVRPSCEDKLHLSRLLWVHQEARVGPISCECILLITWCKDGISLKKD